MRTLPIVLMSVGLLSIGCGPDAVVEDIGINIGFNIGNVAQGDPIESEKNISTEQGNPYGAFLEEIRNELNDDTPFIQLDTVSITLEGDGVHNNFEDIFEGTLELLIVDESAGTTTAVATVENPTGAGPVELTVLGEPVVDGGEFDEDLFQATLNAGSFKIKLEGTAAANAANADVNIVTTLGFSAFK